MTTGPFDWRDEFRKADALPVTASKSEKADRGRLFERILSAMFAEAGLEPRMSFRPDGEEIDGSIWLDGRTILIEAKWTAKRHQASSLYQFKGKVDGKLVGTLGLFISMSGFSKPAVNALVAGKELNIVLADGNDMRILADRGFGVVDALRRKLRAAGDKGSPFLPLRAIPLPQATAPRSSLIIVEGASDVRYLEATRRVLQGDPAVKIVPAAGAANMPRLLGALLETPGIGRLTAIVDGDLQGWLTERLTGELYPLAKEREVPFEVIGADPDLETLLGLLNPDASPAEQRRFREVRMRGPLPFLDASDLLARASESAPLRAVLTALGAESGSRGLRNLPTPDL